MHRSDDNFQIIDTTCGSKVVPHTFLADDDYEIIDRKSGEKVRNQTFYRR